MCGFMVLLIWWMSKKLKKPMTTNDNIGYLIDFGTYLSKNVGDVRQTIIITQSFQIFQLIIYSNQSFSITAKIDGMLASFDFDHNVLEIILFILVEHKIISMDDVANLLKRNNQYPIILKLEDRHLWLTGVVLTCRLGEADKSTQTGECFRPVIIDEMKVAQLPAATIMNQSAVDEALQILDLLETSNDEPS